MAGVLDKAPAAAKHKLGPPVIDVEELEMPIYELRSDQVGDVVDCAWQLPYAPATRPAAFPEV